MTGDCVAHPLLISLANISTAIHMKASSHAFLLLALIPVCKFICPKKTRGVFENRLLHHCLDIVTLPLKAAAVHGRMMIDPCRYSQWCFTPLAAYIADTPEALVIAGVGTKSSPVTMALYKQLGDSDQHEPHTGSTTLAQLAELHSRINPADIPAYHKEVKTFHLNGVDAPFWCDWKYAEPSEFLTCEPLHHWHKMFWDHDLRWCVHALGNAEINFCYSVLQPRVGIHHFKEGVANIKQATGREHREIQCSIVSVIAGATSKQFVIAICTLNNFRYLAQSTILDEGDIAKIRKALHIFHQNKQAILDAHARVGKGNKPIDHFRIPKLELLQAVVPGIWMTGAVFQWSANVTECSHIEVIKNPAAATNHCDYDPQICLHLTREEKR